MKICADRRKRWPVVLVLTAMLLFGFTGIALSSTEGGSGGEHAQVSKGWVATDTYRVMNFTVLAVALFFLLRKPLAKGLGARTAGIRDQLSDLEARKKEAEAQLAAYTEKLTELDQEAERLVAEYVRQGNEAKERILLEAEQAAEKLEAQALRNIEHEFKTAKIKLQADILEKALVKAEEIIQERITAEDQDRLVDEYLEKVVA